MQIYLSDRKFRRFMLDEPNDEKMNEAQGEKMRIPNLKPKIVNLHFRRLEFYRQKKNHRKIFFPQPKMLQMRA